MLFVQQTELMLYVGAVVEERYTYTPPNHYGSTLLCRAVMRYGMTTSENQCGGLAIGGYLFSLVWEWLLPTTNTRLRTLSMHCLFPVGCCTTRLTVAAPAKRCGSYC